MKKEEVEVREKLQKILDPLYGDLCRISKIYGISFVDSCELLRTYHVNSIHAMVALWFNAQKFGEKP